MKKMCIVNFATEEGWYKEGQIRLLNSLQAVGFEGDVLTWIGEESLKCPPHKTVPYAFKTYALLEAYDKGYEMALLLDCSMVAIQPLDKLFNHIKLYGHFMQDSGYDVGQWCSDAALETLNITREEAFSIRCCSAGCTGLNFNNKRAVAFLRYWHEKANDNITFLGAWENSAGQVSKDSRVLGHRHDQTAASVIAYKLNMDIMPRDYFFSYYTPRHKGVCILCFR
ncbi:MAG: hypothetical protein K0R78_335 [Pelosinus sp.]|jgi:hypothetical protein|nr:hypothetical protein [Pelosinus sp.]